MITEAARSALRDVAAVSDVQVERVEPSGVVTGAEIADLLGGAGEHGPGI